MKVKSFSFAVQNRFDCQFKDLDRDEMNSLRGGTEPPIPSSGGDDFIIDILNPKKADSSFTTLTFSPASFTTVVVVKPFKNKKKKD
jgi:hypothetical protein